MNGPLIWVFSPLTAISLVKGALHRADRQHDNNHQVPDPVMPASRSKLSLYLAFLIITGLMLTITYLGIQGAGKINESTSRIVHEYNRKAELLSAMLSAARTRTILLHGLVLEEDPFERDEISLQIDALGAEFSRARATLLQMPIYPQEQSIIDSQGTLSVIAVNFQRQVVDLAAADRLDQAQQLLVEKTVPSQNAVLRQLDLLIGMINESSQQALQQSNMTLKSTSNRIIFLGSLVIAFNLVLIHLITRRILQTENALHDEKEKALTTLAAIGDGVITTDQNMHIESVNPQAEHILEMPQADLLGRDISQVFCVHHEENLHPAPCPVQQSLQLNNTYETPEPAVLKKQDGHFMPIQSHASPVHNSHGRIIGSVLVFRDITQSRAYAKVIEYQATHDTLTNLFNRAEFDRHLQTVFERSRSDNSENVLMFIDLDYFKNVNDTAGHIAGDELLIRLALLMKNTLRSRDFISRRGGDEFAVLLENCTLDTARQIAEKLLEQIMSFEMAWNEHRCKVGASIGLAALSEDDFSVDEVMHHADLACYQAKNNGRGRVETYSAELQREANV